MEEKDLTNFKKKINNNRKIETAVSSLQATKVRQFATPTKTAEHLAVDSYRHNDVDDK